MMHSCSTIILIIWVICTSYQTGDTADDHETPYEISTYPSTTSKNPVKLVSVSLGSRFTIVCNTTHNYATWRTEWFIERPSSQFEHIGVSSITGLVDYPNDLVGEVTISGPKLTDLQDTNINAANHFIIKNFTSAFHMAELQCGGFNNGTRRTFILGTKVVPNVYNDSSAVLEGSNVAIAFKVLGSTQGLDIFPPINYTSWRFNGQEITTTVGMENGSIDVGDYYINFTNISRDRAGIYSLTVSNGEETATGYFALEIYFPPNAILTTERTKMAQINDSNITLIAFNSSSINGWPTPKVFWILPSGQSIIANTEHHSMDKPGELNISNVKVHDYGTYSCILYNGITTGYDGLLLQSVDLKMQRETTATSEVSIIITTMLTAVVALSILVVVVISSQRLLNLYRKGKENHNKDNILFKDYPEKSMSCNDVLHKK